MFRATKVLYMLAIFFSCRINYAYAEHRESYINTSPNTEIFAQQIGSGDDIVIVHGGPGLGYQYMFKSYKPLSNQYRVTFFDQRGSNKSSTIMDAEHINIDKFVEDLEYVRKTQGIQKMHLLSHSFGGYISAYYAMKYPQNLRSLIFICPAPLSRIEWEKLQDNFDAAMTEANIDIEKLSSSDKFQQGDIYTHNHYYKTIFAEYMCNPKHAHKLNFGFYGDAPQRAIQTQELFGQKIFAKGNDFDDYDKLKDIDIPVLVIHGNCDIVPLTASNKLAKSCKKGELQQMNTGHFPELENYSDFMQVISNFIANK